MHKKAEQNITQMFNTIVLLQTKQTLETYKEFCYQLYLASLHYNTQGKRFKKEVAGVNTST